MDFARRFGHGRRMEQHIRVCDSERELLGMFLANLQRFENGGKGKI